jgi:hypothetical protein
MALVKENGNGTEPGTDGSMVTYSFQGSPAGQLFEHSPQVNEVRVMSVQVECVESGHKSTKDGSKPIAKWKITNAQLGREVIPEPEPEKTDDDGDPNQTTIDDAMKPDADYGDVDADPAPEKANDNPTFSG